MSDKKGVNSITKSKYKLFESEVGKIIAQCLPDVPEHAQETTKTRVLTALCDITKFDPDILTYDKQKVARLREQTGKTTYELFYKKYYNNHKDEIDKKNAEHTRMRRAVTKINDNVTTH